MEACVDYAPTGLMVAPTLATAKIPDRTQWRLPLPAMSKSGSAALASGLLSALAMKIVGAVAGPAYVSLLVTLEQIRLTGHVASPRIGPTRLVLASDALDGELRRELVRTA